MNWAELSGLVHATPLLPEQDGDDRAIAFAVWVGLVVEVFVEDWFAA